VMLKVLWPGQCLNQTLLVAVYHAPGDLTFRAEAVLSAVAA